MGQKKLIRFAAIKTFGNVLEYPQGMKGHWHLFFKNKHPVILELACGRGEYAVGLGKEFPLENFIGLDIKGNRMYIGAKYALENGLKNVAFLRTEIDKLTDYFDKGEVSGIWITFPDPQLRLGKAKKRLTHPRFLRLYQQVLKDGGPVHLKTDSPVLYRFTKEVIELYGLQLVKDYDDVHSQATETELRNIRTHYESLDIAQSGRIYYLRFILPVAPLPDKDEQLKKIISEQQPVEGIDYYYNESGYVVLTEKYHLDKGYCCGNGCRHCPFEFEAVPEPAKSELLSLKHKSKGKFGKTNPELQANQH